MLTNAASHILRTSRRLGITERLRERQHTLEELCEQLSMDASRLKPLIDALVAIGFVEQYESDYALARAGHLLCQHDDDLGDARWEKLESRVREGGSVEYREYREHLVATQWIHTSAAMQVAEILDVGGDGSPHGLRILDLGCGAAVWSCAVAHRDPESTVVAIDGAGALAKAREMADSIGMGDRFEMIESPFDGVLLPRDSFDLAIVAQQLSSHSDEYAARLLSLRESIAQTRWTPRGSGLLRRSSTSRLERSHVAALAVNAETDGRVRTLPEVQQMFVDAGLNSIQFTYLAASRQGLGMVVGSRSEH